VRVALALGVLLAALPLAAQPRGDSTHVRGIVRNANSGIPLAGALVAVHSVRFFYLTDSTGTFDVGLVPAGKRILTVVYRESPSVEYPMDLRPGRTLKLEVLLDVTAQDLAPIVVDAAAPDANLSLAGFYMRRDHGFGKFVTRDDIQIRNPNRLSAMLTSKGVRRACPSRGPCVLSRTGSRFCPIAVHLDGVWVREFDVDLVPPQDVAGIEIYKGPEVPIEFARNAKDCGALLIWTRAHETPAAR
jgi:hypothetical protein